MDEFIIVLVSHEEIFVCMYPIALMARRGLWIFFRNVCLYCHSLKLNIIVCISSKFFRGGGVFFILGKPVLQVQYVLVSKHP